MSAKGSSVFTFRLAKGWLASLSPTPVSYATEYHCSKEIVTFLKSGLTLHFEPPGYFRVEPLYLYVHLHESRE